jgi:hypothetical protein
MFQPLTLIALFFSVNVLAFTAKVLEVVPGERPFVKLDNGEVKFLDGQKSLLNVGDRVETNEPGPHTLDESTYDPSVLSDQNAASAIFNRMRSTRWRSQCYNRAHVWAYEEFNRSGLRAQKTFIFFTNSYIRNYNYKWWFHVAPSTLVEESGVKKSMVLDWTFFDLPQEEKEWALYFMESKRACPTVKRYSDYKNNQESEDCYLIKTSMYFWQPLDIEAHEKSGEEKTNFIDWEINRAYRNAL